MPTVTTPNVRECLKNLFAIHGFPNSMLTDNVRPWRTKVIKQFFKLRGNKHIQMANFYQIQKKLTTIKIFIN